MIFKLNRLLYFIIIILGLNEQDSSIHKELEGIDFEHMLIVRDLQTAYTKRISNQDVEIIFSDIIWNSRFTKQNKEQIYEMLFRYKQINDGMFQGDTLACYRPSENNILQTYEEFKTKFMDNKYEDSVDSVGSTSDALITESLYLTNLIKYNDTKHYFKNLIYLSRSCDEIFVVLDEIYSDIYEIMEKISDEESLSKCMPLSNMFGFLLQVTDRLSQINARFLIPTLQKPLKGKPRLWKLDRTNALQIFKDMKLYLKRGNFCESVCNPYNWSNVEMVVTIERCYRKVNSIATILYQELQVREFLYDQKLDLTKVFELQEDAFNHIFHDFYPILKSYKEILKTKKHCILNAKIDSCIGAANKSMSFLTNLRRYNKTLRYLEWCDTLKNDTNRTNLDMAYFCNSDFFKKTLPKELRIDLKEEIDCYEHNKMKKVDSKEALRIVKEKISHIKKCKKSLKSYEQKLNEHKELFLDIDKSLTPEETELNSVFSKGKQENMFFECQHTKTQGASESVQSQKKSEVCISGLDERAAEFPREEESSEDNNATYLDLMVFRSEIRENAHNRNSGISVNDNKYSRAKFKRILSTIQEEDSESVYSLHENEGIHSTDIFQPYVLREKERKHQLVVTERNSIGLENTYSEPFISLLNLQIVSETEFESFESERTNNSVKCEKIRSKDVTGPSITLLKNEQRTTLQQVYVNVSGESIEGSQSYHAINEEAGECTGKYPLPNIEQLESTSNIETHITSENIGPLQGFQIHNTNSTPSLDAISQNIREAESIKMPRIGESDTGTTISSLESQQIFCSNIKTDIQGFKQSGGDVYLKNIVCDDEMRKDITKTSLNVIENTSNFLTTDIERKHCGNVKLLDKDDNRSTRPRRLKIIMVSVSLGLIFIGLCFLANKLLHEKTR